MIKLTIFVVSIGFISAFPDFYFYSPRAINTPVKVNLPVDLNNVNGYDPDKETKFIIHGFGDNHKGVRMVDVKNRLIPAGFNVIIVDWEKGAAMPWYWSAVDNTRIVGRKLADFIIANDIPLSKAHCIGHSLGAHTCGFAGKSLISQTDEKIARITGLDPAGPWFKGNPPHERLDKNDAILVDVIHTDDMLGIQDAIGHKDYYPNGGGTQNGCGVSSILNIFNGRRRSSESHTLEEATNSVQNEEDDTKVVFKINLYPPGDPRFTLFGIDMAEIGACSHVRVMHFFAESVDSKCLFTSTQCTNYSDFQKGRCVCDPLYGCSPMGLYSTRNPLWGKFYLDTNRKALFCQG